MFSQGQEEIKLEWMYKGPHSSVDREEYLLGRSVDKTLEHINSEEKQQQLGVQQPKNHVEHECIPPSIRDYKLQASEQVDLTAKLQEDPLIAIKKREEENRRQFLNNPIQIKKLQKALKSQKCKKKKHKQQFNSDSEEDLDAKLAKKLKLLKENPGAIKYNKSGKKSKEDSNLDTILMHKYNELKNKLSNDDLRDILQGKASDSNSNSSEDEKDSDASNKGHSRHRSESASSSDSKKIKKHREHTLSKNKRGKLQSHTYEPEVKKKYSKQKLRMSDDKQKHNTNREKHRQDSGNYDENRRRSKSADRQKHRQDTRNYNRDRRSRSRSGSKERKQRTGASKNYDTERRTRSRSTDRQKYRKETRNYNSIRKSRSRSGSKERKKRGGDRENFDTARRTRSRSTDLQKYRKETRNYNSNRRSSSRSNSKERKKRSGARENFDKERTRSRSTDRQKYRQETRNYNRNRRSRSRSGSKEVKKYRGAKEQIRSTSNAKQNYKNDKEKYNMKHKFDYNAKEHNRNICEKLDKRRQGNNTPMRERDSSSSTEEADYKGRQKIRDHKSIIRKISKKDESSSEEEIAHKRNRNKNKETRNKRMDSDSSNDDSTQKSRNFPTSSSEDSDGNPKTRIKNWGLVRADGTKLVSSSKHVAGKAVITHVDRKVQETKAPNFLKRTKLTEEEKEKRRKEMMANAAWRDLERAKHLKHHRETELKEDQMQKQYDPEFIQKQLIKSANNSTVESRIKANINNIQRSGSDMNKHFSKR